MNLRRSLIIRNVEIEGQSGLDVRIEHDCVAEIGFGLEPAGDEIDGEGGALIPGLADHHVHLMALAAQADSIVLDRVTNRSEFESRIAAALVGSSEGTWIRAVGYHETMAGELNKRELDLIAPRHRLRVQHQTGSLWILNSLALESVGADNGPSDCVERGADGRATGRIWRGDAWLRGRMPARPLPMAAVGQRLTDFGITSVTDASVTNDTLSADILGRYHLNGQLPQRLTIMSGGELNCPPDGAFAVGPVKIVLDDYNLPDLDELASRIEFAHASNRVVAVHCVTAAELAVTLAALEAKGSVPGDRIEHGSIIPIDTIAQLRALRLVIVTQPGFTLERGDRYVSTVAENERQDLNRCGSLLTAGISVVAGSDAPYGPLDPWLSIATAVTRRTLRGQVLGEKEKIEPMAALSMYLGDPSAPGRTKRRVTAGGAADLCLLKAPLADMLDCPSSELVRATFIGGQIV